MGQSSVHLLLLAVCVNWCRCELYNGSYSSYTSFPNDIPSTVTILDLSHNELTNIMNSDLTSFGDLVELNLSFNNITFIETNTLTSNLDILKLNLSHNQLSDFPEFPHSTLLTHLDLAYNNITSVPSFFFYSFVEHFDLSYNSIDWTDGGLDGVAAYSSVTKLVLSGTKCTSGTTAGDLLTYYFEGLHTLVAADCSPAMIAVPEVEDFFVITLSEINFNSNALTTEDIENSNSIAMQTDLQRMYLSDNDLTAFPNIPNGQRSTLLDLDLSDNEIGSLDTTLLQGYTVLERLNLSDNQLTSLSTLPQIDSLTSLDLSSNQISSVDVSFLSLLPVVTEIDLSSNHLEVFPNISQQFISSNLTLYLNSNQFVCNCSFAFLLEASDAYGLYANLTVVLDQYPCMPPLTTTAYTSLTVDYLCTETTTSAIETTTEQMTTHITDVTTTSAEVTTTSADQTTNSAATAGSAATTAATSVQCAPFPTWLDIELSEDEMIGVGSEILYECKSGYKFKDGDDQKTSTCSTEDGTWSSRFKSCYERVSKKEASTFDKPVESKNAEVIGSIAILLVVLEIAFMLLLDFNHLHQACATFRRRNCHKRSQKHEVTRKTKVQRIAPSPTPILLTVPAAYTTGNQSPSTSRLTPRHSPIPHTHARELKRIESTTWE